jgi:hypothetical protein
MRKYAVPQSMSVEYLVSINSTQRLSDHLGSTSITTDNTGAKVSEMRYKPCPLRLRYGMLREGEVRFAWTATQTTTPSYKLSQYTFTGQYSYMDDPSTSGVAIPQGDMLRNNLSTG